MKEDRFILIILGMFMAFLIGIGVITCQIEANKPKAIELPDSIEAMSAPDELRDHLKIVCIGGFSYYFATWEKGISHPMAYTVFAPKLEADGKPSTCVMEKKEPPK